jgi:hypothetical protein
LAKTDSQNPSQFRFPLAQFRALGADRGDLARERWEVSYRAARYNAMSSEEANRELIAFRGFGTAQDAAAATRIQAATAEDERLCQEWFYETAELLTGTAPANVQEAAKTILAALEIGAARLN